MTIKSVDMQVLVQKAGDVARIQHTQHNEANQRQGEFFQLMVDQTVKDRQTVHKPRDSQAADIHERQTGEQGNEPSKDQNSSADRQSEQDQEIFGDFYKGSTINIKI